MLLLQEPIPVLPTVHYNMDGIPYTHFSVLLLLQEHIPVLPTVHYNMGCIPVLTCLNSLLSGTGAHPRAAHSALQHGGHPHQLQGAGGEAHQGGP